MVMVCGKYNIIHTHYIFYTKCSNRYVYYILYVSHLYRVIEHLTKWTTFASISRNGTAVTPFHVITQYILYFVKWIPKPSSTELVPSFECPKS